MFDSESWTSANLLTLSERISLQAPLGSLLWLIPPVERVRGRLNRPEDGCLMPRVWLGCWRRNGPAGCSLPCGRAMSCVGAQDIGPLAGWMPHEADGLTVKDAGQCAGPYQHLSGCTFDLAHPAGDLVPPAGFEPARAAPEAVALSPELRGLKDRSKVTSPDGRHERCAAAVRTPQIKIASVKSSQGLARRRYSRARGAGIGTRAGRGRR